MNLPEELIQQIKFYCRNNDLGMSAIYSDGYAILVIGDTNLSANFVHLAAAHSLISGVLTGQWNEANVEAGKEQREDEERKPS